MTNITWGFSSLCQIFRLSFFQTDCFQVFCLSCCRPLNRARYFLLLEYPVRHLSLLAVFLVLPFSQWCCRSVGQRDKCVAAYYDNVAHSTSHALCYAMVNLLCGCIAEIRQTQVRAVFGVCCQRRCFVWRFQRKHLRLGKRFADHSLLSSYMDVFVCVFFSLFFVVVFSFFVGFFLVAVFSGSVMWNV